MPRLNNSDLQQRLMLKGVEALLNESPAFRKFLWTWMRDLGIFIPQNPRGTAHDLAYEVGRRAAGLEVLHMLKDVRPDIIGLLDREGNLMEEAAKPQPREDHADLQDPDPYDFDPDLEP